jgi:hypothetical protein
MLSKISPIHVVFEDFVTLDSSENNMMLLQVHYAGLMGRVFTGQIKQIYK